MLVVEMTLDLHESCSRADVKYILGVATKRLGVISVYHLERVFACAMEVGNLCAAYRLRSFETVVSRLVDLFALQ